MTDSAVSKAYSRPPAGVWKGEAALGSLAYASGTILSTLNTTELETRIFRANTDVTKIPAIDSSLPYSPKNIAARYKVIASTGDDFVQARLELR